MILIGHPVALVEKTWKNDKSKLSIIKSYKACILIRKCTISNY